MNQVPIVSSNVRQRIAPVVPDLLSNVRPSRDPRLLRQTLNTAQLPLGNAVQQGTMANFNGPTHRMSGNFPNSNNNIHRNRIPRYSQNESVINANNSIDSQSKEASKETKSRSSSSSSYKNSKAGSKSSPSSSSSSKSKSSSKGSSSKSSRESSRSGSGRARSSSSSKDRKDDSKSPRKFHIHHQFGCSDGKQLNQLIENGFCIWLRR